MTKMLNPLEAPDGFLAREPMTDHVCLGCHFYVIYSYGDIHSECKKKSDVSCCATKRDDGMAVQFVAVSGDAIPWEHEQRWRKNIEAKP